MKVAALYDIHGNLPALEALLDELSGEGVDRVVVGGDVLPGPMPRETIDCLLSLNLPVEFIYGNGEAAVLEHLAGREPGKVPAPYLPAIHWTAEEIRAPHGSAIAGWPMTRRLDIPGIGSVLFCHATPRNEDEIFTATTRQEHLLPIFSELGVPVVVCGHTHMQFDRMVGGTRVVNAGSVGMPFGAPGADWLLLGEGDTGIQLRHTDYDLQAAAARVRDTAFPWPEDFAARHILRPPSAAEMLDVFARASL